MDTRLRVGLLLDSPFIPAWAFTAIERSVRSGQAEVALLIVNQRAPRLNPAGMLLRGAL